MKLFFQNIAIILVTVILLFLLTMLLDIPFIKALVVRQILVYIIMAVITFVCYRIVSLNK